MNKLMGAPRRIFRQWLLLILLGVIVGCSQGGDGGNNDDDTPEGGVTFAVDAQAEFLQPIEPADNDPASAESVAQFNKAIVSLLTHITAHQSSVINNNRLSNRVDALAMARVLALLNEVTRGSTRNEIELLLDTLAETSVQQPASFARMFSPEVSVHTGEVFAPQYDHLFSGDFVSWVYRNLSADAIQPVDYARDLASASQALQALLNHYISDKFSTDSRMVLLTSLQLDAQAWQYDQQDIVPALFNGRYGTERQIEAARITGPYKQLFLAEGEVSLVPLVGAGMDMALVQPDPAHYDYVLSELPAILAEARQSQPVSGPVHVPLVDMMYSGLVLSVLFESLGAGELFDREFANLSGLDGGGQYVSVFTQYGKFLLSAEGLSVQSESVLATDRSDENVFLGPGDPDGGIIGAIISSPGLPPLVDTSSWYQFHPLIIALVDAETGALVYLQEVGRANSPASP